MKEAMQQVNLNLHGQTTATNNLNLYSMFNMV